MTAGNNIFSFLNQHLLLAVFMLLLAVGTGLFISKMELPGVLLVVGIVPFGFYVFFLVKQPLIGLFTALAFAFFVVGITRYIAAPFGLVIDSFLLVTVLIVLAKSNSEEIQNLNSLPFYVFGAWFLYTIMQLFNPLAPGFTGWFYAVRGTSFNFFFILIISLLLISEKKHVTHFIYIWFGLSLLAVLYGLKQKFIGLDGAERAWLDAGNASTHILHGRLRVFSFYSDAGQFGVAMAHVGMVSLIFAVAPVSWIRRIIFAGLGLLFMYGMAISGTRGALFVPVAGALVYLIASRNFKILVVGLIILGSAFVMLKYTHIGQGNYEIQRLRSALNPEDASLNVRQNNQRILAAYLADKPFGGGIGTSGYFGLRFNPNSLLAQTPTDSWYVRIWAETGVVGLFVHLGGLLLLLVVGFFKVFTLHDPVLRNMNAGLLAGYAGIVVASYGNAVIGQFPTNIITIISIAIVWKSKEWDVAKMEKLSSE